MVVQEVPHSKWRKSQEDQSPELQSPKDGVVTLPGQVVPQRRFLAGNTDSQGKTATHNQPNSPVLSQKKDQERISAPASETSGQKPSSSSQQRNTPVQSLSLLRNDVFRTALSLVPNLRARQASFPSSDSRPEEFLSEEQPRATMPQEEEQLPEQPPGEEPEKEPEQDPVIDSLLQTSSQFAQFYQDTGLTPEEIYRHVSPDRVQVIAEVACDVSRFDKTKADQFVLSAMSEDLNLPKNRRPEETLGLSIKGTGELPREAEVVLEQAFRVLVR